MTKSELVANLTTLNPLIPSNLIEEGANEILEKIAKEINENTLLDGITITGGDPLFNPIDMLKVLKFLKENTGKNIWLYTGYTIEQIRCDELRKKCLEYVDVLVDGRFVKELYDPKIKFRGSSNQRIIKKEDFFIK